MDNTGAVGESGGVDSWALAVPYQVLSSGAGLGPALWQGPLGSAEVK